MAKGKSKVESLKEELFTIVKDYNINPKQLEALIEAEKYRSTAPTIDLSKHVTDGKVVFGALSDTRLNSKYMRPDFYKSLYAKFKEEGVSYVFHCGDITDGYMRYKTHPEHQITQSYDEMLEHFLNPKKPEGYPLIGVNTYFIGGNIDGTFLRRKNEDGEKTNVCIDIEQKREDLVFAGWNEATVKIASKTRVMISHPLPGLGSRKPQAISQPLQAKLEAFGAGQKPDILLMGYFQRRYEFPGTKGVMSYMIPSCISQTPHDSEKNIQAPALGGMIFEVYFNKDGSMKEIVTNELPFYA